MRDIGNTSQDYLEHWYNGCKGRCLNCRLFQGTKLERINESDAKLTFADIAGIDNVKAEVYELVAFLQNPKRFMDLGAVSPSGILLVGGPGTGNVTSNPPS